MPVSDFYRPFTFDGASLGATQNFLRVLQNPSNYTVTQSTESIWLITLNTPVGEISQIEFNVQTAFTGTGSPPDDLVDSIRLLDNVGAPIASFTQLAPYAGSISNLISNPARLVSGSDDFLGSDGADIVHLGAGDDLGGGGGGDDQLFGGDGDDTLYDVGNYLDRDILRGEAGSDYIVGSYGDVIDGGADFDVAVIDFFGLAGVTLDLSAMQPGATLDLPGGGQLSSIEAIGLLGTTLADTLTLGAWHGYLDGRDGDDILTGNIGDDVIYGGAGDDILRGGDSVSDSDDFDGGDGDDIVYATLRDIWQGGAGYDRLYLSFAGNGSGVYLGNQLAAGFEYANVTGSNFRDHITPFLPGVYSLGADGDFTTVSISDVTVRGESGDDFLSLSDGDNVTLEGGVGDDNFGLTPSGMAGTGNRIDGGDGIDLIEVNIWGSAHSNATTLVVDLRTASTVIDGVVVENVERMFAHGNGGDDRFYGGAHNDDIHSWGGADIVYGGAGNDTITDYDWHYGATFWGADYINGGDGDDEIEIYASWGDFVDGGDGNDRAVIQLADPALSREVYDFSSGNLSGLTVINVEEVRYSLWYANGATVIGSAGADYFTTGLENDTLYGADGDDRMNGGGGVDRLYGEAGNDILDGYDASDWLYGGAGDDVLYGDRFAIAGGDDVLEGGRGADILEGGVPSNSGDTASYSLDIAGVEVNLGTGYARDGWGDVDTLVSIENLTGSAFNDMLTGGAGVNVLNGGAGDDILNGDIGDDILIGGAGNDILADSYGSDTASFADSSNGVSVDLSIASPQDTGEGWDTFVGIENVIGSAFNDTMRGDGGANLLQGGAGDDILNGAGGDDRLEGGLGVNTLIGGDGLDLASYASFTRDLWIDMSAGGFTGEDFQDIYDSSLEGAEGGSGNDTLLGGVSTDLLIGGSGADVLIGNAGDDILRGGEGHDWLVGGDGDDVLDGGPGYNTLIGGDGFDIASYQSHLYIFGIWASLEQGTARTLNFPNTQENLESIEGIRGSIYGDQLLGDAGSNLLMGDAGNDVLRGLAGDDTLDGGTGNDWLDGGDGDDILEGGAGVNILIGGSGLDLASYQSATTGLWIDMGAGVYAAAGVWDVFQNSIEGAIGGGGDDTLLAAASGSTLLGRAGHDTLIGLGGNDTLIGGDGDDWLRGGDGDDLLEGGAGVNILIGGAGLDLASYLSATTGLWIDMSAGVHAATGVWDVFLDSIDGAIGGTADDVMIAAASGSTLLGGAGDDTLVGGGGGDTLVGGDGADWIVGGDGDDRLDGGAGGDFYTAGVGTDVFALGAMAGWDVAFDFDPNEDRFDLAGNLWLGIVEADWDGDGQNDDTMLGYAGGNFVALDVSGLTLEQWNALVIG